MYSGNQADVLEKNLRVLKQRFPLVARSVQRHKGRDSFDVRLMLARSGTPSAQVLHGGHWLHVHSSYDPLSEARRWLEGVPAEAGKFAVLVGFGLGYHAELWAERFGSTAELVVIEPNVRLFSLALRSRDLRPVLSRKGLYLMVGDEPAAVVEELLTAHGGCLLRNPEILAWPSVLRYARPFWDALHARLRDELRRFQGDFVTTARWSTSWIDNFFKCLPLSLSDPGVRNLFGLFPDRPGILVAAGPSLEKNVHLLPRAKGRAVVIAAGSAINALLKAGIEPDLVVSMDPGRANYRHFSNVQLPDVPLVYVPTVFASIPQEYAGPRFVGALDAPPFVAWAFEKIGADKGTLRTAPSIANTAWDLAAKLGCSPIILVGQDLAYTDLKTHADGVVGARRVRHDPSELLEVEAVDGTTVLASPALYMMKLWFERHLQSIEGPLTIDATEGGARVAGTRVSTLSDAMDTYCVQEFNARETILAVHREAAARIPLETARTTMMLSTLSQEVGTILRLCRRGLRVCEELSQRAPRMTPRRYDENMIRLQTLDTKLTGLEVYGTFIRPLIEHVINGINLALARRLEEERTLGGKAAKVAAHYAQLFESVESMAQRIQARIREVRLDTVGGTGQRITAE